MYNHMRLQPEGATLTVGDLLVIRLARTSAKPVPQILILKVTIQLQELSCSQQVLYTFTGITRDTTPACSSSLNIALDLSWLGVLLVQYLLSFLDSLPIVQTRPTALSSVQKR